MMEFEFAIILISTIGTAVWTVLTWTDQQEKERNSEQEQIDALYINPFLLATEELQALLYSILVEGEIEFFRREISHEGDKQDEITYYEALEVLYVIIKYFGWSWYLYRYSSYTQDKTAIELTRNVSETFADRQKFGQDAFRFTFTKQRSLGQMFVRRLSETNSPYPEFKATPLYQFLEEIIESKNQNAPLYQSITKTIETIRRATSVEDLTGRERLIEVQNELVDLLNYIELKEGFSVSSKRRKKTKLVGRNIIVYEDTKETTPQIVHKTRGRIRLKIPQILQNASYADYWQSLIQPITGIESIQVNQKGASVTIEYDDRIPETEFVRTLLETINQSH